MQKLRLKTKKTRAERSEEIRDSLLDATAKTVGEYGYMESSIAKITQRANLAQGTFYNYFESRQEVFDELLPVLGVKMSQHIRLHVQGVTDFVEHEEISFRAFFDFLKKRPYFLRIMNEAEIFAPKAHRAHFKNITDSYIRFLRRASDKGDIDPIGDTELEALVYILVSGRSYLAMRYLKPDGTVDLPEEAVAAYMRLIRVGLAASATRAQVGLPDADQEQLPDSVASALG